MDGVQSENMYLLFNRVNKPPVTAPDSAIWHFGWGSTAMETDYEKHRANGIIFHTPITRLNSGLLFAYMKAPMARWSRSTHQTHALSYTSICTAMRHCALLTGLSKI